MSSITCLMSYDEDAPDHNPLGSNPFMCFCTIAVISNPTLASHVGRPAMSQDSIEAALKRTFVPVSGFVPELPREACSQSMGISFRAHPSNKLLNTMASGLMPAGRMHK